MKNQEITFHFRAEAPKKHSKISLERMKKEQLIERVMKLETLRNDWREGIIQLQATIEEQTAEIASLEDDLGRVSIESNNRLAELEAQKTANQFMSKTLDMLSSKIKEQDEQLIDIHFVNDCQKSRLETAHTDKEHLESLIDERDNELERLYTEIANLEIKLGDIEDHQRTTERSTRAKIKEQGKAQTRANLANDGINLEALLGTEPKNPRIILITWVSYVQTAIPNTERALEYIVSNFDSIESLDYLDFETL